MVPLTDPLPNTFFAMPLPAKKATVAAATSVSAANAPPSFLRGPVLHLHALKQQLRERVDAVLEGPEGIRARYGVQCGPLGAARCAGDGLVADLLGGAGTVWDRTIDDVVAELHEKAFENYNRWCSMVRLGLGRCFSKRACLSLQCTTHNHQ